MTRIELCASDDDDTLAALAVALESLEAVPLDSEGLFYPATGLNRYQLPGGEVSVFLDAFVADLAGPDDLVQQVLDRMNADG